MLTILWKLVQFIILMVPVPLAVGTLLRGRLETTLGVKTSATRVIFRWIAGQFLLWAGFQLICVPMILLEQSFTQVVLFFSAYSAVLTLAGVVKSCRGRSRAAGVKSVREPTPRDRSVGCLWLMFAVLFLLQLVCACVLPYADGDDAYYVAVSTITENADTMYLKLPYTGGTTGLDVRHGLAPMPIWIAYLARLSGIRAVTVAQIAVPLVLLFLFYGIFFLLGSKLFGQRGGRLPLFLVVTELLVLFGGYSIYSVENFLIARTAQGKAMLGNLVLPMLVLLILVLLERVSQGGSCPIGLWVLLWAVMLTGCLCSTQGAALVCFLTAVAGLCGAAVFRKWKFLLPLASSCIFPCVYAVLYFMAE